MTTEEFKYYQTVFKQIRDNSTLFEDIQHHSNCIRQQSLYCLENGDEKISSTAFHMIKILQRLEHLKIITEKK